MKAVALAVVLALVVGGQCASNCHWGPSYWCQNQANAEECGGTQYCKENVWKKADVSMVTRPQNVIECEVCKIVVDFIKKELLQNKTEDEVKQALMQFCNSTGPLAKACVDFINDEFDDIWNEIVNNGADDACAAIGACTSSVNKVPHPLKKTQFKNPLCSMCEEVAQKVLDMVESNFTKAEIKVEIKKVCPYLGGFAPECRMMIETFFDEIWNAATQALSAHEICETIKMCSASKLGLTSLVAKPKIHVPMDVVCEVCQTVMKFIKPFVDNNSTEGEVKSALEIFCKILPGNYSSECSGMVKESFGLMWTILKSGVDTGELCSIIKLCNESTTVLMKQRQQQPKVQQGPLCDLCTLVASFLKPYVDSNSTEKEVEDAIETFCSILPGNLSSECNELVDSFFPVIWDLLQQEVDSGDICNLIGVCNKTALRAKFQARLLLPKDTACDVCKIITGYLKPYVDSDKTEAEVKALVQEVCSILPSGFKTECNDTVNQYFDLIWQLLKSEVDGDEICTQIGLCGTTKTHLKKGSVGGVKGNADEACEACKLVVKYLKEIADNNVTESAAKEMVEAVCDKAGPMKDECDSMVDSYFPMVWKLLRSYVDDDEICSEIKVCANVSKKVLGSQQSALVKVQSPKLGGVFCMLCELVMKELTSMLDTNATQQAIEDALDKVCGVIPSSFSEDCTHFVDKYGPEIIQLILSGTAGKAVCAALGLCVLEKQQFVALGGTEDCFVCKTTLELAKTVIASKSAETKVDDVLENVCKLVPSGIQNECTDFIETFGPQLIQLLDKAIDPQAICAELKLCSKTTSRVALMA